MDETKTPSLESINTCRVVYHPSPLIWRVDLHRKDGDVWTLADKMTKSEALELMERAALYFGLPMSIEGEDY